jgi:uncharacterized protein
MRIWFKYAAQVALAAALSPALAGSYEDFFTAVQRDDDGAVTVLLRRGFDPNSHDPQGQTGLTLATRDRNWRVVKALLDSTASDVNELNANGESPLMLAALRGEMEWCVRLLERGARAQLSGWAPIHYAATGPNPAVVALLLERGAERDAASPNGSTPLMLAARYGSEASVDLLLARGADITRRNERGLTPADFARLGGRESLAARLTPR